MKRRWVVRIDADVEDVEIEADAIWYTQETGWLTFRNRADTSDGYKHVVVFAPGKWVYCKEVTDEPR